MMIVFCFNQLTGGANVHNVELACLLDFFKDLASINDKSLWSFVLFQLSEELLGRWLSYPEGQHVPLSQHMLGFAMKCVTQLVMGSTFEDEQEVIRFQKNHGTVSIWGQL